MSTLLEELREQLFVERVRAPIMELVGFDVESLERGQAVLTFEAGSQHHNPMGTLHGGILCDVGDAAMGMAYASTLAEDETFTTLELKINFLRPVRAGRLRAVGTYVSGGRTVGLARCDIEDELGRLIAQLSSTCMTLRGEQAEGRRPGDFAVVGAGAAAAS